MFEYKDEIRQTRVGYLGSSDGAMLAQVAKLGSVPKSAYERLAVCKGLVEQKEIPETPAIRFGNETEMQIYEHLQMIDNRWQSNVRLESVSFTFKNFSLIAHPDFYLQDEEKKTIYIGECKATKFSIEQTRVKYGEQLYIHFLLAMAKAKELGKGWKVRLSLCHYDTNGLDLTQPQEFDSNRLTIRDVRPNASSFEIFKALIIVDDFLQDFNEYYKGDEIGSEYLPEQVKAQFDLVANTIAEIEKKKAFVDEFKERLYQFMCEKEIKSIKAPTFTISRVDETESKSFDHKKYIEDYKEKHPRKAKKLVDKYTKVTKRKGYATIRVFEKDNINENN